MNKILFLLFIACSLNSCIIGYAFAMREKTIEKKTWKQGEYRVKIHSRLGGFGPMVNTCTIYKTTFLFRKKIVEHYFSYNHDVADCELVIIDKGYRYAVNVCADSLDVFH